MKNYFVDVISDGICMGNAVVLNLEQKNSTIRKSVAEEKNKLGNAIMSSLDDLNNISKNKNEEFIEVHKMLLTDAALKDELFKEIEYNGKSAYEATNCVFNRYIKGFKESKSSYLKERYLDFLDIKERILRNIEDNKIDYSNFHNVILVVEELLPSLLVDFKDVKGVICKNGGFTSHAGILCRSLDIPCVVLKDYDIHTNDEIIIDTRRQIVDVNPSIDIINHYQEILGKIKAENFIDCPHPGYRFMCNITDNSELDKCLEYGFDGVGLYRTEWIFMNSDRPLSEEEQYNIYLEAVTKMNKLPICFRTFDVGDDKQLEYLHVDSKGVRNYMNNPTLFESQIKALLRANIYGNMKIMFPMIETKEQFYFLRNWVYRLKEEMANDKQIEIGMMLETKMALDNIGDFGNVDFISLGTNDLTKEVYNISRSDNISYKEYLDDLLKRLKPVVDFCKQMDISLSVCGELASIREATKGLMNIGINNFSVSAPNIKTLYLAFNDKLKEEKC